MQDVVCSQNCKNAGPALEAVSGYHGCAKEDLKINSLEKRSGCKYCPSLDRIIKRKVKE